MSVAQQEIKQRYFDKVYKNAIYIDCACGCGSRIKNKDRFGRDKMFLNGHNGRKYADPTEYKRAWNHRNREQRYLYKMNYYRKRKVELILYKGGECQHCLVEYNGINAAMFQFDHREPKLKKFQLGNQLTNRSKKEVYEEVDKCDLLCANCHSLKDASEY